MSVQEFRCRIVRAGLAMVLLAGLGSCGKKIASAEFETVPAAGVISELAVNGLGSFPGALYRTQADSPIPWQPWSAETLLRAKRAKRLILAVVVVPQQPGYSAVLAALAGSPQVVAAIRENYVPVLIDADAAREMGLLAAVLCEEIKRPLQLPMLVWMTQDGDPVAWTPISEKAKQSAIEVFSQTHATVARLWADDARYVLENSALDQAGRRKRMEARKSAQIDSEKPASDTLAALRQLVTLYDVPTRSFDEAGGLFPAGALELLGTAAIHPGIPADLRVKCAETTRCLLQDLSASPMFDPLDGGIFSSRVGKSWSLPTFRRDCSSQARIGVALLAAYRAAGEARVLGQVRDLIAFIENHYATAEGLFAAGQVEESRPGAWHWTVEQVEQVLGPEDAAWWMRATGMRGLGNLPPEVDPYQDYFRSNTLGLRQSVEEIAAEMGQSLEVFRPRFEAAREKLLQFRTARLGSIAKDECSHAGASFRMVSLYAAAHSVTGEAHFLEQAVRLLERSRERFGAGPQLRIFAQDAPASLGAGRAFLYGLAIQAALDVAAITAEERWLAWAEDLSTTATEVFLTPTLLLECPEEASLVKLPVTDLVMLFEESSTGLFSLAQSRLATLGRPFLDALGQRVKPLPLYSVHRPILFTDLLQASLAREFPLLVVASQDASEEMKLALARLPLRLVQRRLAKPADGVPSATVKVICGNAAPTTVTDLPNLQRAVLPASH